MWLATRSQRGEPSRASRIEELSRWFSRGLTFELSRHQRCDARARMAKMYRVPPAGPTWHAVGARLERGVRQRCAGWARAASEAKNLAPFDGLRQTAAAARCGPDRGTHSWTSFSRPMSHANTMAGTAPWLGPDPTLRNGTADRCNAAHL